MKGERIRVMIVEDEAPARAAMRELLVGDPDVELVGETWGARAVEELGASHPDLVFLDVRMPGLDGFGLLERLDLDPDPVVIFVTAHDEHAVRAFDVEALDYLVKPFTDERFCQALRRAKRQVAARKRGAGTGWALLRDSEDDAGRSRPSDRLVLEDGGTTIVLPESSITWIEASGPYVVIHTPEREHLVRRSLTSLEERLAPRGFFRVHRSALVNLVHVREVHPLTHGDGEVVLNDRTRVKLSRSRRGEFEDVLRDTWGS